MKNLVALSFCLLSFLFIACGEDKTTEIVNESNVARYVATFDSLPKCDSSRAAQIYLVEDEEAAYGCTGYVWKLMGTAQAEDYECYGEYLADSSGFVIYCGEDSIGVIMNGTDGEKGAAGKNGKDGVDGASGTGCGIVSYSDSVTTIACGLDTFDINLYDLAGTDERVMHNVKLSGVSQKGPFVKGSMITAYGLANGSTLKQTGTVYSGRISNDNGEFNISTVRLPSQYAYLVAEGFYRNEVTGENSTSQITLKAITDLSQDRKTVNVNLLTHLEYGRVVYLVTREGYKVRDAKKKAEKEILAAFHMDTTETTAFEDLNIFGKTDADAALLAISILAQGNRSESELTKFITILSSDMKETGVWKDSSARMEMADWVMSLRNSDLAAIRKNVESWNTSATVPKFETLVNQFAVQEYAFDSCTDKNNHTAINITDPNSIYYAKSYMDSSNSSVRFACIDGLWHVADVVEKNTPWNDSVEQATVRNGAYNKNNVYVYEGDAWRLGTKLDSTLKLGGCTWARDDEVALSGSTWYKCDSLLWRTATQIEKDTNGFGVGEEGEIRTGAVTASNYYYYENEVWRKATTLEVDTYGFGAGEEGEIRTGAVTTSNYYYENGAWRKATTLEVDTYGFGAGEEGEIRTGNVNTTGFYIYENGAWKYAVSSVVNAAVVKDTTGFGVGTDGEIRIGESSKNLHYLYDAAEKKWSLTTNIRDYGIGINGCTKNRNGEKIKASNDTSYVCYSVVKYTSVSGYQWFSQYQWYDYYNADVFLNENLEYTSLTYQSRAYRTIKIGEQTWLAENLSYTPSGFGNQILDFNEDDPWMDLGIYYSWNASMNEDSTSCGYGVDCSITLPHQGFCPENWHLPSAEEWKNLVSTYGSDALRSAWGWTREPGTNSTGLSAAPVGVYKGNSWTGYGTDAYFWTSSQYDSNKAYYIHFDSDTATVDTISKNMKMTIRCVKDEE